MVSSCSPSSTRITRLLAGPGMDAGARVHHANRLTRIRVPRTSGAYVLERVKGGIPHAALPFFRRCCEWSQGTATDGAAPGPAVAAMISRKRSTSCLSSASSFLCGCSSLWPFDPPVKMVAQGSSESGALDRLRLHFPSGSSRAGSPDGRTSTAHGACFHAGIGARASRRGTNGERSTSRYLWM